MLLADVEDVDRGDNRGVLRGAGPGLRRHEDLPAPRLTPPSLLLLYHSQAQS